MGGMTDFLKNFTAGMKVAQDVGESIALAKNAGAESSTQSGFTTDQGQQINQLADAGYTPTYDAATGTYTLTNAKTGDAKTFKQRTVTDIVGGPAANRYVGNESQGRAQSIADTVAMFDPTQGAKLKTQANADQLGQQTIQSNQNALDTQKSIDAIHQRVGDAWVKAHPDNAPGTFGETIDSQSALASGLMAAGHVDEANKVNSGIQVQLYNRARLDTTQRQNALPGVLTAAQSGDLKPATGYMNQFLNISGAPLNLSDDGNGNIVFHRTDAEGNPLPDQTMPKQTFMQTLQASASPQMAYNIGIFQHKAAQEAITNQQNQQRIDIAQSGEARQQTAQDTKMQVANDLGDKAVQDLLAKNPDATPVDIAAARAAAGRPDTAKKPALLQIAQAAKDAGLAKDDKAALEFAKGQSGKSASDVYTTYMSAMMRNPVFSSMPPEQLGAKALALTRVQFPDYLQAPAGTTPSQLVAGAQAPAPSAPGVMTPSQAAARPPAAAPNLPSTGDAPAPSRIVANGQSNVPNAASLLTPENIAATAKATGLTGAEVVRRYKLATGIQ